MKLLIDHQPETIHQQEVTIVTLEEKMLAPTDIPTLTNYLILIREEAI